MKLAELNARFVSCGGEGVTDQDGNPVPYREGVGIGLDCPCGCKRTLCVLFSNPLDGGPPINAHAHWDREGDIIEIITLKPSIQRIKIAETDCTWHGFITNGEAHE